MSKALVFEFPILLIVCDPWMDGGLTLVEVEFWEEKKACVRMFREETIIKRTIQWRFTPLERQTVP